MSTLNLIGLILNLVGTIVVSLSAGRLMTCINTALLAVETTVQAYLDRTQQIVPVFTGLEKTRQRELARSGALLRCGLWLVVGGFVMQALAAIPQ